MIKITKNPTAPLLRRESCYFAKSTVNPDSQRPLIRRPHGIQDLHEDLKPLRGINAEFTQSIDANLRTSAPFFNGIFCSPINYYGRTEQNSDMHEYPPICRIDPEIQHDNPEIDAVAGLVQLASASIERMFSLGDPYLSL